MTSDGRISAKEVGTTHIVIYATGNDNYDAGSTSVAIQVIPATPVLQEFENKSGGVLVAWKKVVSADGYYLYRNNKMVKSIAKASTVSYTDTTAKTNGTKYTYTLQAYKKLGADEYPSKVSAAKSVVFLGSPGGFSVKNLSGGKLKASWKKNAAATGYKLQYATNSKFSGAKTVTLTKTATSKTLSGLKQGKKYYVRISTVRSKVASSWSATKSVQIKK